MSIQNKIKIIPNIFGSQKWFTVLLSGCRTSYRTPLKSPILVLWILRFLGCDFRDFLNILLFFFLVVSRSNDVRRTFRKTMQISPLEYNPKISTMIQNKVLCIYWYLLFIKRILIWIQNSVRWNIQAGFYSSMSIMLVTLPPVGPLNLVLYTGDAPFLRSVLILGTRKSLVF